jgi:PHD/YefM family antitoxin component YafN of YafNO toxin-antitoxin module
MGMNSNRGSQTITTSLEHPVILEQDGKQIAVLISPAEYNQWQATLQMQEQLTAAAARRAADKALFQDLAGCALSSGEPVYVPTPPPRWRVPYRFLPDGGLAAIIEVDARSGTAALTETERRRILSQLEEHTRRNVPSALS